MQNRKKNISSSQEFKDFRSTYALKVVGFRVVVIRLFVFIRPGIGILIVTIG